MQEGFLATVAVLAMVSQAASAREVAAPAVAILEVVSASVAVPEVVTMVKEGIPAAIGCAGGGRMSRGLDVRMGVA